MQSSQSLNHTQPQNHTQHQVSGPESLSPECQLVLQELGLMIARRSVSKKINSTMTPVQIATVFYAAAVGASLDPNQNTRTKPWSNMKEMLDAKFVWVIDNSTSRSILFERLIIQALDITENLMVHTGHMVPPPQLTQSTPVLKPIPIWKKVATPVVWTSVTVAGFIVAVVLPQAVKARISDSIENRE